MTVYNFDELDSFTTFTFQGHEYQFWYPTTEEAFELQKMGDDIEKLNEFILSHVRLPEGADYPDFKEVYSQMNVKQSIEFNKMITKELGVGTD